MQPPHFFTGKLPEGALLWAAVDANVNYLEPRTAETRFAAYLAPYRNEEAARQALLAAGVDPATIALEQRRRNKGARG